MTLKDKEKEMTYFYISKKNIGLQFKFVRQFESFFNSEMTYLLFICRL